MDQIPKLAMINRTVASVYSVSDGNRNSRRGGELLHNKLAESLQRNSGGDFARLCSNHPTRGFRLLRGR